MRSVLLAAIVVFSTVATFGCGKDATPIDSSSSSSGGTTAPPAVSAASPLALKLYTVYDTTTYENALLFTTGSDTCAATSSSKQVTCTVQVPEGRLYMSTLHFSYSWTTAECPVANFLPYYYQAAQLTDNAYVPPGNDSTSTTDCTSTPTSRSCYGGAAPQLVSTFPKFVFLRKPSDESGTSNYQDLGLASAWSGNENSNRRTVNDMPVAKQGNTYASGWDTTPYATDGYYGDYHDYLFWCTDHFDDYVSPTNYAIKLYVEDLDSDTGNTAVDDLYTWKELP